MISSDLPIIFHVQLCVFVLCRDFARESVLKIFKALWIHTKAKAFLLLFFLCLPNSGQKNSQILDRAFN